MRYAALAGGYPSIYPMYMNQFRKEVPCKQAHSILELTLTGRHRLSQAPSAVGLAADDPLASVVVAGVTDEHQLGLELVLGLIDEPPPAVFHTDAADVGTGHSWGNKEQGRE